jgi:hypothetical protein
MTDTQRIRVLERTLATLINWMASSANSPISIAEAKQLLTLLDGKD